jgi:translation initiation factor 2 subunit 2
MESFQEMFDNLYDNLHINSTNVQFKLPIPILIKNGSNYLWKNPKEFLKLVKRPPDHFVGFLAHQLNCNINWITESKSDGLIITKKIDDNTIILMMKNYLKDYIFCKSCKSNNTYITKDKEIRKYHFICLNCSYNIYL